MFAHFLARALLSGVVVCGLGVVTAYADQAKAQLVTVSFVVDGDTVELDGGERVRLLGVDTPEDKRLRKSKGGKKRLVPAQPFFLEAKHFLRNLIEKNR